MAGTIVASASDAGSGYTKYSLAWTSDGSGNVSGAPVDVRRGRLVNVKFVPGSGGTQPTDQYDVTVTDADGADVLMGSGANQSNATASWAAPGTLIEAGQLTLIVAAAGSAKTGRVDLFIGP